MSINEFYFPDALKSSPAKWLVTGAAGFIGSNLVETLLKLGQHVVGFDNFATGHRHNLVDIEKQVGEKWKNFHFIEGSITDVIQCKAAVSEADYVLHQAALGSVPKSIEDPRTWNEVNVAGTLNMFIAARDEKSVKGFSYASSSSVYGDSAELPKKEERIGKPLSPYAASKYANELYGEVFSSCYGFPAVGLRYFNVFGKRQDPNGAYAAVVPRWIDNMLQGTACVINGDGTTSRDFCYIANVVQANILGALSCASQPGHRFYNVGVHEQTTLTELHALLAAAVSRESGKAVIEPTYQGFRAGDVKHSLANIDKIKKQLNFQPTHSLRQGIDEAVVWYWSQSKNKSS